MKDTLKSLPIYLCEFWIPSRLARHTWDFLGLLLNVDFMFNLHRLWVKSKKLNDHNWVDMRQFEKNNFSGDPLPEVIR
jgi:hypothetical protein